MTGLLTLRVVRRASLGGGAREALDTLASSAALPADDLVSTGAGWLPGLTGRVGAPFCLDLYASGARGEAFYEVDAFALATVYGQVLWDDRAHEWHADSGRTDSAARMREIHDLALRVYRALDDERLVVVAEA